MEETKKLSQGCETTPSAHKPSRKIEANHRLYFPYGISAQSFWLTTYYPEWVLVPENETGSSVSPPHQPVTDSIALSIPKNHQKTICLVIFKFLRVSSWRLGSNLESGEKETRSITRLGRFREWKKRRPDLIATPISTRLCTPLWHGNTLNAAGSPCQFSSILVRLCVFLETFLNNSTAI